MSSPERLNVLISRARNGLIMIGNENTFRTPRAGDAVYQKFFGLLDKAKHVYRGLPVRCEYHPNQEEMLTCAGDFDTKTPDGGCHRPW